MPGRVLMLFHPGTIARELPRWAITSLANVWREDGLEVAFVTGTAHAPPADVLVVHIDLSVVPDEFLRFAERYPVAINGQVKDIRKSTISRHQVTAGDGWAGPVIVKSNLNCCGFGERMLARRKVLPNAAPTFPFALETQLDYRVFERAEQVPSEYFADENLVVERFLPEREGDDYYCRSYHFLGSKATTVRLGSKNPIVLGHTAHSIETIEPHADVLQARAELKLDYGKIDYVVHEGRAVIFDVNKTTGEGGVSTDPRVIELRRYRASGIYDFLPRGP